jgi:signal recognition particle receptor subunit beta
VVQINFAKREINCKLVYYGPGLSGKTTNLEVVHKKAPASKKGELTSIATEGDRTLFFDYMPLELGKVGGMNTKFQLYTVPGQVYYNATRKLVLQGADGVVFVADSQPDKMDENLESLQNLEDNLKEQGLDLRTLPIVLQWNKRDLPNVMTCEDLDKKINRFGAPTFEAVAVTGEGVFPTLRKLAQMVLEKLNKEYGLQTEKPAGEGGEAGPAKASGSSAAASKVTPKPAAPPAAEKPKTEPAAPPPKPVAQEPKPTPPPKPVEKAPPPKAETKPPVAPPKPPVATPPPVAKKDPAPTPTPTPEKKPVDRPFNVVTGGGAKPAPEPKGKGGLIAVILIVLVLGGVGAGYALNLGGLKDMIDKAMGKQGG